MLNKNRKPCDSRPPTTTPTPTTTHPQMSRRPKQKEHQSVANSGHVVFVLAQKDKYRTSMKINQCACLASLAFDVLVHFNII